MERKGRIFIAKKCLRKILNNLIKTCDAMIVHQKCVVVSGHFLDVLFTVYVLEVKSVIIFIMINPKFIIVVIQTFYVT